MKSTARLTVFARGWGQGCEAFAMSDRSWGLPEAIARTLRLTGPAAVDVCTFSLGVDTVNDCLHAVKVGRATRFRYLVHSRMVASRTGRGWSTIYRRAGAENIRIASAHAKFALIDAPGWRVAIITSGNMNANREIEAFAWHEGEGRPAYAGARAFFDEAFATLPAPLPPKSEIRVDRVEQSRKRSAHRSRASRDPLGELAGGGDVGVLDDLLRGLE